MSSDTCLSSFGARLFVLAPPVPLVPWFPSLCCTESEDSIDGEVILGFITATPVLPFSAFRRIFSHRDPMYCTLSFNRVQVQTLPTEQAALVPTDSFSRGYDPYTHACKARPLMTVGRTSLSVIVIVIVFFRFLCACHTS